MARERQVDAVLVAGDLINLNADVMAAIGDLKAGFAELGAIPVFAISGNHDFSSLVRVANQFEGRLVPVGLDRQWEVIERRGYRIAGRSFAREHEPDLAVMPEFALDDRTVVLAHGDMDIRSPYRPHESKKIEAAGGHWVFGHVHSPSRRGSNWFYTTSPQALDPGETGVHGVHVIEFDEQGGPRFESVPISTVRYETVPVGVTGLSLEEAEETLGSALAEFANQDTLAVLRVELEGRSSLLPSQVAELETRTRGFMAQGVSLEWVGGSRLRPELDLPSLAAGSDGKSRLAAAILALERGEEIDPRLQVKLESVFAKIDGLKIKDYSPAERAKNAAYRILEVLP